jgi:hypothetical protein
VIGATTALYQWGLFSGMTTTSPFPTCRLTPPSIEATAPAAAGRTMVPPLTKVADPSMM